LEDELRRQFPGTPAWGQVGSRGGDVSVPTSTRRDQSSNEKESGKLKDGEDGPTGETQPKRSKKPNPKFVGPDWVARSFWLGEGIKAEEQQRREHKEEDE
jgi:hypothetical protein